MNRLATTALTLFCMGLGLTGSGCGGSNKSGLPLDNPDAAGSAGGASGGGGSGTAGSGGSGTGTGGSGGGMGTGGSTMGTGGARDGAASGTGGMTMGTGGMMTSADGPVKPASDAPPAPKPDAPPPTGCNPGAACTMGCSNTCKNMTGRETCVCIEGSLFCGGCVVGDAGEAPDCPVNPQGMMCDANATVCRLRPEVGMSTLCACKGDGAKRTWRCP